MNLGLQSLPRGPYDLDLPNGYPTIEPETQYYLDRVRANGGTLTDATIGVADFICNYLNRATYRNKISTWHPWIGGNLLAALVPVWDPFGFANTLRNTVGTALTNAAFSEATGLTGTGTGCLQSTLNPGQFNNLLTNNNGGIGWWAKVLDGTGTAGTSFCGKAQASSTVRFELDSRVAAGSAHFFWQDNTANAGWTGAQTIGHFYGQRSGPASREIFKDGVSQAVSVVSNNTASDTNTFYVMGVNEGGTPTYTKGQCYHWYMTTGDLTSTEVTDFHNLLVTVNTMLGR